MEEERGGIEGEMEKERNTTNLGKSEWRQMRL